MGSKNEEAADVARAGSHIFATFRISDPLRLEK